jgi:hypothetical protein
MKQEKKLVMLIENLNQKDLEKNQKNLKKKYLNLGKTEW